MIIPEWLFQEPIKNKFRKKCNTKPLRQLARDKIKLDDTQLKKYLARKTINPYYFSARALNFGFKIALDTYHISHSNSKLAVQPNFTEFGNEFGYIKKILREMATIDAGLKNQ